MYIILPKEVLQLQSRIKYLALKSTALITVMLLYFPVIMTIRFYLFKQPEALYNSLYEFLSVFAGFLAAVAVRNFIKKTKAAVITTCLFSLLPLILTPMIFHKSDSSAVFFMVLVSFILFIAGLRAAYVSYTEIIGHVTITGGVVLLCFASLIMVSLYEQPSCRALAVHMNKMMAWSIYPFIILFTLLRNHSTLDAVLLDENNGSSVSLKRIRVYNIAIVSVLFALSAFVLHFKAFITGIADLSCSIFFFAMNMVGVVLNGVLGFLVQFMGDKHVLDASVKSAGKVMEKATGSISETPAYIKLVVIVFGSVLSITITIYFIRVIRNAAYLAGRLIVNLTRIFKSGERNNHTLIHEDTVEGIGTGYRKKRKLAGKAFRYEKALAAARSNIEKVRCMYGIIMVKLKLRRLELSETDTTGSILKKAQASMDDSKNLKDITRLYDKVRYRDYDPTGKDIEAISNTFRSILKDIGR